MEIVQKEGNRDVKRQIEHYNLDLIIAVGYRVNSVKATQFRRWATGVLKNYLVSGYTLNKEILQNNPEKFKILLQKIAEIRNSEKTKNLLLPSDIKIILNSISYSALWQDIVEFEKLDERVAIVNCIFANLIGVNNGYIECCPSDNAPSLMESFTWWWVVRPDLGAAITINLHKNVAEAQKLREAIADYILGLQWRGYF